MSRNSSDHLYVLIFKWFKCYRNLLLGVIHLVFSGKYLIAAAETRPPQLSMDKVEGPRDFPGGAVVKNPPANAGDVGSIAGPGRCHMPWRS